MKFVLNNLQWKQLRTWYVNKGEKNTHSFTFHTNRFVIHNGYWIIILNKMDFFSWNIDLAMVFQFIFLSHVIGGWCFFLFFLGDLSRISLVIWGDLKNCNVTKFHWDWRDKRFKGICENISIRLPKSIYTSYNLLCAFPNRSALIIAINFFTRKRKRKHRFPSK